MKSTKSQERIGEEKTINDNEKKDRIRDKNTSNANNTSKDEVNSYFYSQKRRNRHSNLYSLDVYIHEVIHFVHKATNTQLANDCCVGFRLWEYPFMYLQKKDPYENERMENIMFKESFRNTTVYNDPMYRQQANTSSHKVLFRIGKSLVFKMEKDELNQYLQTLPLYVYLFILTVPPFDGTNNVEYCKPVLLGSFQVLLRDLEINDVEDETITPKRVISGTFNLKNDRGYDIGIIDMDIRLRKLSSESLSHFSQYLTDNFTNTFSLQRPMTLGGPFTKVPQTQNFMDGSKLSGAVTTKPVLTVTDKTFQSLHKHNNNSVFIGYKDSISDTKQITNTRGEFDALSQMVDQYQNSQIQSKLMKGQIEQQLAQMTVQLTDIARRLNKQVVIEKPVIITTTDKEEIQQEIKKKKKVKKKEGVLYTNRSNSTSKTNNTKKQGSSGAITTGRDTTSYLTRPTKNWFNSNKASPSPKHVTKVIKTSPQPTKAKKKEETSKIKEKKNIVKEVKETKLNTSTDSSSSDSSKSSNSSTKTTKVIKNDKKLKVTEDNNQNDSDYITIPVELYKTIKNNNDRYNNLQKSYQLIMEEFMDQPEKIFSTMERVDTAGMSEKEKELLIYQTKLIHLLKENYANIKKNREMSGTIKPLAKEAIRKINNPSPKSSPPTSSRSSTVNETMSTPISTGSVIVQRRISPTEEEKNEGKAEASIVISSIPNTVNTNASNSFVYETAKLNIASIDSFDTSFKSFKEDFEDANESALSPSKEVNQEDTFKVVNVEKNETDEKKEESEEEEFEDFDTDFEPSGLEEKVNTEKDENEDEHQEDTTLHSVDYSQIEDRNYEDERI
ncbi:hypothetical protein ABK040_001268 [Willaertia magna]